MVDRKGKKMRAVVTGGNGFIGRRLSLELLNNGYELVVISRHADKLDPEVLHHEKCRCVVKDIKEVTLEDLRSDEPYDVFFNLCWDGVASEDKNNLDKQLNNIHNSLQAIDLCHDIGCRLFVSSGTVAEYALTTDVMDLESKQCPNDFYGATKVAVHYYLTVRANQLAQPFIWCVLPSTYGEGRASNNIITYTIKTLLKREKPQYGDLNQMWDFLYVSEVARALRYVGEKGIPGKVYGIGSGEYRPLKEYICTIRDLIDPNLLLGIGEKPDESKKSFSSCVNIYDLIKDTGFKPQISFEDGITRTIEYYRK